MTLLLRASEAGVEFPFSLRDLRQKFPNVSFGDEIPTDVLSKYGVYPVLRVDPPKAPKNKAVIESEPKLGEDGKWYQGWDVRSFTEDEVAAQLGKARDQAFRRINDGYNEAVDALVSTYPKREVDTFTKQEREAVDWLQDNTASTPFIDGMLITRDIEKVKLVDLILAKAAAFADATGQLTGKRQSLEKQVEEATTVEEVEAIVW